MNYAGAAVFAAVFAALYAAHQVGDHWTQTRQQAAHKDQRGHEGRAACTRHLVALTVTKLAFLGAAWPVLHLPLSPPWLAVGLAVDAGSHWWADRRFTLAALAARLDKADFYQLGQPRPGRDDNPTLGTAAYALDQSWHVGWLFVAALITAAGVA